MTTEPAVPATRTSGLAIASLALSLGSILLGPLASIPAIVTGMIAWRKIRADPTLRGEGMALTGLILGCVFTALVALFAVVLFIDWGMRPAGGN